MKNYIAIYLIEEGKLFAGRLYGDRIEIPSKVTIAREKITNQKIPWRGPITLQEGANQWNFQRSKQIIDWLNPSYRLRRTVSFFLFAFSAIFMFFQLGWRQVPFILLYALASGALAYAFLSQLEKPLKTIFLRMFLLIAVICIPALYLFLFSWPFFFFYVVAVFLLFLTELFLGTKKHFQKYYLGITWAALIIYLYFWTIWAVKISIDQKIPAEVTLSAETREYEQRLVSRASSWTVPTSWKTEKLTWSQTLIQKRNLAIQISPLSDTHAIHLPITRFAGWVGVSDKNIFDLHRNVMKYLEQQKDFLWAKLGETRPLFSQERQAGMPAILVLQLKFFDLASMSNKSVYLFYVMMPPAAGQESDTWLFCLDLPPDSSPEYYLNAIVGGFPFSISMEKKNK